MRVLWTGTLQGMLQHNAGQTAQQRSHCFIILHFYCSWKRNLISPRFFQRWVIVAPPRSDISPHASDFISSQCLIVSLSVGIYWAWSPGSGGCFCLIHATPSSRASSTHQRWWSRQSILLLERSPSWVLIGLTQLSPHFIGHSDLCDVGVETASCNMAINFYFTRFLWPNSFLMTCVIKKFCSKSA